MNAKAERLIDQICRKELPFAEMLSILKECQLIALNHSAVRFPRVNDKTPLETHPDLDTVCRSN